MTGCGCRQFELFDSCTHSEFVGFHVDAENDTLGGRSIPPRDLDELGV
jgi:hypothetical protein